MAKRSAEPVDITPGTKNVFEGLGYPDAAERQVKLRLAFALNEVLDQSELARMAAAKLLGLTRPKVSALRNYRLSMVYFTCAAPTVARSELDHECAR